MATGEVRGLVLDVRAGARLRRRRDQDQGGPEAGAEDTYVINGQKMWLTNGGSSNLVAVLVKTDEGAESVYKNMTTFLVEKETGFGETAPGAHDPRQDRQDGLQGRRHHRDGASRATRSPPTRSSAARPAKGFYQMMDGVEVGRVNVAARASGVANRAFELAIAYAQQRETFGKKIAEHQAILFRLAEMATKVETAHAMMVRAARMKDARRAQRRRGRDGQVPRRGVLQRGGRSDSFRIHGGYGYSKEYEIERLYREAAFLLIGEGTADIQKMIIGRALLKDYKLKRLSHVNVRPCHDNFRYPHAA